MAKQRSRRKNVRRRTRRRKLHRGGEEKCLYVTFPPTSGLGNVLFVYAAALGVKQKINIPLCFLPYTNNHSTTDYREVLLKQGKPVEISMDDPRIKESKRLLGELHNDPETAVHRFWEYKPEEEDKSKNLIMGDSYYQNYAAIKSVIPTIRSDFADVCDKRYRGFKESIKPSSAFLHVRRGDFGNKALGADYYKKGLSILDGKSEIESIYILSDDLDWCKSQGFESSKIKWFDNPEEAKDEIKTMYLMSLCKAGACISGSTFSTWGAILGPDENEKSTIVIPSKWFAGFHVADIEASDFQFPSRWQVI